MIYLASPYKNESEFIRVNRYAKACAARDYFLRQGMFVYSPIAHNHNSINLPNTWDFWSKFDFDMLSRCDKMFVLKLEGWKESVGVTAEINFASQHQIPVYYIEERLACDGWGNYLSLDDVLAEAAEWAKITFTKSTIHSKAEHLSREAEELKENPTDRSEIADCLILIADLSHGQGIDMKDAVERKMIVNYGRKWGKPDEMGVVEHVD